MTPNSSTINFDPAIPTDWEKSTYYVRDAQGNVMAIYEYTIDDVTQDNHYTLTERNIYGSSRLGNNNAPVEMIATTPPNPSQYSHHIGYRQYELSNHLGNVLAVISDRKIARDTDQDNTVDYYEPDVLLTYDYSPFGAPLHARSFTKEVCDEVTSTQKIEDLNTDFTDGTAQGWTALSSTPILSVTIDGKLEIKKQGGGAGLLGVQQSINATSGVVYDFSIFIENGFTSNATIVLEVLDPNNTVIYTQSVANGNPNPVVTFTHQFTASTTGTYLVKVYRTGNQSNGAFFIDDALITHEEEVTQTLCEDFAGYRYGFNGMEKDNEVKGAGNSYDFGARLYDSRLGRWLAVDPSHDKYPDISSFAGIGNNPIVFIDPDGKVIRIPDGNGGMIVYTPGMTTTGLSNESAKYVNHLNNIFLNSSKEIATSIIGLANSNMVYNIQIEPYSGSNPGGSGEYNGSTQQFDIVVDEFGEQTIQILADELAHASQFESNDIGYAVVLDWIDKKDGTKHYKTQVIGYDYQDEIISKQWAILVASGNNQDIIPGSSAESYYENVVIKGRDGQQWLRTYVNAKGESYVDIFQDLGQNGLNKRSIGSNYGTTKSGDPKSVQAGIKDKTVLHFIYRRNGKSITEDTGDDPLHYGNDNNAKPD